MAPSASMLFLSYHQLPHGPAAAEAEAPRSKEASGFQFSFRNVFSSSSSGVLAAPTRRDAAPGVLAGAEAKQSGCHAGGDRKEEEKAAALGSKFEEAVRLSCWSS